MERKDCHWIIRYSIALWFIGMVLLFGWTGENPGWAKTGAAMFCFSSCILAGIIGAESIAFFNEWLAKRSERDENKDL